ncbi:hypothetical protein LXL04_033883 [Taraxacum kok-saghyz]
MFQKVADCHCLLANSPFTEGKPNGYLSLRIVYIFHKYEKYRANTNILSSVKFGPTLITIVLECSPLFFMNLLGKFSRIIIYVYTDMPLMSLCILCVGFYVIWPKKKYIDFAGLSFRTLWQANLLQFMENIQTLNEWENHLTTIFPGALMKGHRGGYVYCLHFGAIEEVMFIVYILGNAILIKEYSIVAFDYTMKRCTW